MSKNKVTVREAAERLGITPEAVRKRIERGSIEYERREDGRLYVVLDNVRDEPDTSDVALSAEKDERIADLKEQNAYLQEQVEAEREARRRADHLLAQLMARVPELEAAYDHEQTTDEQRHEPAHSDAQGSADPSAGSASGEAHEGAHRPWWKRIFGA